jgi:hypothetical protein
MCSRRRNRKYNERQHNRRREKIQDEVPIRSASQEKGHSVSKSLRKRKSDDKSTTTDLHLPAQGSLVPIGLVHDRITQLGNPGRAGEGREVQKKQRISNNKIARSASAANNSPHRVHESHVFELSGLWEA